MSQQLTGYNTVAVTNNAKNAYDNMCNRVCQGICPMRLSLYSKAYHCLPYLSFSTNKCDILFIYADTGLTTQKGSSHRHSVMLFVCSLDATLCRNSEPAVTTCSHVYPNECALGVTATKNLISHCILLHFKQPACVSRFSNAFSLP